MSTEESRNRHIQVLDNVAATCNNIASRPILTFAWKDFAKTGTVDVLDITQTPNKRRFTQKTIPKNINVLKQYLKPSYTKPLKGVLSISLKADLDALTTRLKSGNPKAKKRRAGLAQRLNIASAKLLNTQDLIDHILYSDIPNKVFRKIDSSSTDADVKDYINICIFLHIRRSRGTSFKRHLSQDTTFKDIKERAFHKGEIIRLTDTEQALLKASPLASNFETIHYYQVKEDHNFIDENE